MHNNQLGKFAPAMVTTGSHPANAMIDTDMVGAISTEPAGSPLRTAHVLTPNKDVCLFVCLLKI
jgi:hypothetical protein